MSLNPDFFAFFYLIATILFIYGLKGLSSPKTALRGNGSAMIGMLLAVSVTLLCPEVKAYGRIFLALFGGGLLGTVIALKISMTAMPQLVAILHSFVGLSAIFVVLGTFLSHTTDHLGSLSLVEVIELGLGTVIGAITVSGSWVAFGKLQGILKSNPLRFPGQHALNGILGCFILGFAIRFCIFQDPFSWAVLAGLALVLGLKLVLPIGGADMPVIVSMLNSYSGWAASATGFTLGNQLLVTTGALVGSSGAILSYIMCKAMNRSILSVIFGGVGGSEQESSSVSDTARGVKSASVDDLGFMLENASQVIIVPGYGLAVAQAQHAVKELYEVLVEKKVVVKFAIHPVAGRMPGHMNVLLAESDIPYDCVFGMEEINAEFSSTDVGLVIGANDVVNPLAKTDKTSPLYGMPILDVYKAKHVFVCKRSMHFGYSGMDNALFYYPHCSLVFGDAKSTCDALVAAVRNS